LARTLKGILPEELNAMVRMLPQALPPAKPLPAVYPAVGTRRARVALLAGCVQQALEPEINWATLRVLARNGMEVLIPPEQGCCGALAMHTGDSKRARVLAARNLRAFAGEVDAVLTNAAGCGSGMKEYPLLFKGTEMEDEAATCCPGQDVTQFLDDWIGRSSTCRSPGLPTMTPTTWRMPRCDCRAAPPFVKIPNLILLSVPEANLLWIGGHV
jgi:glycolate oxidase iron-sulfur subunit